jgi:hypothetical protein
MDEAAYREKEQRQVRPGLYHANAGSFLPDSRSLMPNDTRIRSQITGSMTSRSLPVNEESDLRGIGRPVSRAPASYKQGPSYSNAGDTVMSGHHSIGSKSGEGVSQLRTNDVEELRSLDSRLDMPALALRGATPNRFHPNLLRDPSEFSFAPFDRLVSSRIVMKDQWRPPVSSLTSVGPPTIPANVQQKPAY